MRVRRCKKWGNVTLRKNQYNGKKALEIVLPDTIITDNTLTVLNDFKIAMKDSDMEVWYRIVE